MKLLFVVSSLDLTQPFSATPAWWMLLKGLYETGVEVIATPYQGPAIESLWWRAEPNPAQWQGDAFRATRDVLRRLRPPASPAQTGSAAMPGEVTDSDDTISADDVHDDESVFDRLTRQTAHALIAPLWFRHLDRILTREGDVDAVIVLTVPLNHLTGVPERIRQKHGVPVFYYDGDVPASLPDMKGFASGFRIYQGSRPEEYTAFISNSQGGATHLRRLGAREVHTLFYAADPDVYAPIAVDAQDIDAFFYGHGAEYRAEWIAAMLDAPSRAMPDARFAVRGTRLGALPQVEQLPYLSFSKLREYGLPQPAEPVHHAWRPCQCVRLLVDAAVRAGCDGLLHRGQPIRWPRNLVRAGAARSSWCTVLNRPSSSTANCWPTRSDAPTSARQRASVC